MTRPQKRQRERERRRARNRWIWHAVRRDPEAFRQVQECVSSVLAAWKTTHPAVAFEAIDQCVETLHATRETNKTREPDPDGPGSR
jgi:hypothetical protein